MITDMIPTALGNAPLFFILGTAVVSIVSTVLILKKDARR